ncbi:MAG: hypothetical protein IAF08_06835 [Rhizobacter sp.]|nr:hypothetical protein [Chlorobiales bacterium]
MTKCFQFGLVLLALIFAQGCESMGRNFVGRNFERPDVNTFILGKTTSQQITSIYGKPYSETKEMLHGELVTTSSYYYSIYGSQVRSVYREAKNLACLFAKDTLVGYVWSSSFEGDSSNFDDSKITRIQKGKTAEGEVVKLLGKPNGIFIYPATNNKADKSDREIYYYCRWYTDINSYNYKTTTIRLDSGATVKDIDYSSSIRNDNNQ